MSRTSKLDPELDLEDEEEVCHILNRLLEQDSRL